MLYLALPTGSYHGWGVCGKYLVRELSALAEVALVTEPFDQNSIGDELDYRLLRSKAPDARNGQPDARGAPVLQAITGAEMLPYRPQLAGSPSIGYTFFEENLRVARHIGNARAHYELVVAGSTWCEQVLRDCGLSAVQTILQGVDEAIFHPAAGPRQYFREAFVVFSGGKLELRKGQDLVIRAFQVLQERHPDVMLVNSWYNFWPFSMETMRVSPHIRFQPSSGDYVTMVNQVLADNGIDVGRVVTLAPAANVAMARVYRNTDVGLFPNRCEGGSNLVMMEYMACGKPVIAAATSGHRDILTAANSIRIERLKPLAIRSEGLDLALWDEPDLEETISHLEWAYQHRDELARIGRQAGEDLAGHTWRRTAEEFFALLAPAAGVPR